MPHPHDTIIRVRYAETDQMGVVYYANYFVWFEIGRVEFLRHLGLDYRNLEQQEGCHIVVADARCRYKAPARYDDEVRIRTRLKSFRATMVQFEYEAIRVSDGLLLAEGETKHIVTGKDMKIRLLPETYVRAFERLLPDRPALAKP